MALKIPFSQTTHFRLFQTERDCRRQNLRKFSKRVENTVGKEEIARYEQFLLFPQCFQKKMYCRHVKTGGLFGKGLPERNTISPHTDDESKRRYKRWLTVFYLFDRHFIWQIFVRNLTSVVPILIWRHLDYWRGFKSINHILVYVSVCDEPICKQFSRLEPSRNVL